MPPVLFLHQLDDIVDGGCQHSECTTDHSDGLFLTPFCHDGAGVSVWITDQVQGLPCDAVIGLRCWACEQEIVQVAIVAPVSGRRDCGHDGAFDVWYEGGQLTISCRPCHAVFGTAPVAPYLPA